MTHSGSPQALLSPRLFLKILLGALALSACAGAMAIFTDLGGHVWRVAGVGLAAAATCGVLMRGAKRAEDPRLRPSGLAMMGWAVGMFLIVTGLFWSDQFGSRVSEGLGVLLGGGFLCGVPALWLLTRVRDPLERFAVLTGVALCLLGLCLMVILGLITADGRSSWLARERYWASAWALVGAGVLGAGCLSGVTSQRQLPARHVGTGATLAALLLVLYGIWVHEGKDATLVVALGALSLLVGHINVTRRAGLIDAQRLVLWGAQGAVGAAGLLTTLAVYSKSDWDDTLGLARLATGSGIVAASGTAAIFVIRLLNRRAAMRSLTPLDTRGEALDRVEILCPRCRTRQQIPAREPGGSGLTCACLKCRLRITVTLGVPTCSGCGYDLSDIDHQRCPECGLALPPTTLGQPV